MTKILTYSLKNEQKRSDAYYQDVGAFTDEVNQVANESLGDLIIDYQKFLINTEREEIRGFAAYAFELLTLGVLWPIYIGNALGLGKVSQRVLSRMVALREKYVWLKPFVDPLRGLWGSLVLFSNNKSQRIAVPDLTHLSKLLGWLETTGDFKEEVKRLNGWQIFLGEMEPEKIEEILSRVLDFGKWFEARSLKVLGAYTPNVEQFIEERSPEHRWMEDLVLVRRKRVEYHLNLVGMEVLNRDIAEVFAATPKKIVFVPPCLRIKKEGCEAYETPYGDHCNACEPDCRVHQVTQLGAKHGFEVFFLPRRLTSLGKDRDPSETPAFGIVGVACPLTVVTGGWQTRDMGIPALGLPLDHCGCHWHWDLDKGVVTDVNFGELLKMVGKQV